MILDSIAFFSVSAIQFEWAFSLYLPIVSALYLIGKGLLFRDFMSIVDSVWGGYILIALLFNLQSFFYYIILIWFLYKLGFTFLGQMNS